jgi:RNA polymerase sigma-70 factor (ECF subfamily)
MSAPDAPLTDEQLAQRARSREPAEALRAAQDACRELYRRQAPGLLAFLAARVPRADLEDVHHEVWMRVWKHLPAHFDGSHFRGWLYRIARNYLVDRARRRRPEGELEEDRPDPRSSTPEESLLEEERRRLLADCMKRLNATLAELVRGRLGGEDYGQLCARLGLAPERAHKLFHTAKTQLQDCVGRDDR